MQASGNVAITTQGEVKNDKDVYAGGTLSVTTSQALTNSGSIGAQGGVQIQAMATENLAGARIASNATVQVNTSGAQTNQGEIVSAGNVTLHAARLQNEGRLLSIAGDVNITSQGDVDNSGPTAQIYAAGTQHIGAAGALRGSTVSAAGSVSITASGKGKDSGILIRGGDISAGKNASPHPHGLP
ncbi:MAG: hypothetical protein ACT6UH_06765 [Hydrogenophaga sp.]|uniref:hypothetical protein n=1 Tax=Hydrogenophaga sp. TaxID=1904254 RepID=UPI0040362900